MFFKSIGCIIGRIIPLGFLNRFEQALNYIRSGYYSVSNPSVKSVLIEKCVYFIGFQYIKFNGGGNKERDAY